MSTIFSTTITISGMSCSACQKIIEKRFSRLDGVYKVTVHVNEGKAEIQTDREIPLQEFQDAIQGTHYQVINSI